MLACPSAILYLAELATGIERYRLLLLNLIPISCQCPSTSISISQLPLIVPVTTPIACPAVHGMLNSVFAPFKGILMYIVKSHWNTPCVTRLS